MADSIHFVRLQSTQIVRPLAMAMGAVDPAAMRKQLADLRAALTEYFEAVQTKEGADDAAFGESLGLSDSAVSALRRGARNVTVEHLAALAALQGVSAIVVLADVAAIMGRRMRGGAQTAPAPGSTEGSHVTPEVAAEMKRLSGSRARARRKSQKPDAPK